MNIETFQKSLKDKHVIVIGDLMLDEYIVGSVNRISPEAPVPVVNVKEEFSRFGGAANVCLNIASLGATAIPIGVIGNDTHGKEFLKRAKVNRINCDYVVKSTLRPTTVKTRVIAGTQQIVRYDREQSHELNENEQTQILNNISATISNADAIIFQDYNKGVITKRIIIDSIRLAKSYKIPVFVDPKFTHFFDYKNVFMFKPNARETAEALQINLNTEDDFKKAAVILKEKLSAKNILLTMGAAGMLLYDSSNQFHHVAAQSLEVADVSGAGDTVISTFVCAILAEFNTEEATRLANKAAGVVVQELGIVPILPEQLK